jgi:hypothetical protein
MLLKRGINVYQADSFDIFLGPKLGQKLRNKLKKEKISKTDFLLNALIIEQNKLPQRKDIDIIPRNMLEIM